MAAERLTILGAGSVEVTPAVLGSLAGYFGERPLQIWMYDADAERLDAFERLANLCFMSTYAPHKVIATTDPREALAETDAIVLSVDGNCARRYLRTHRSKGIADIDDLSMIEQAVNDLLGGVPGSVPVLSLLSPEIAVPRGSYHRADWPARMDEATLRGMPMQLLRWLNREDMLYDLLAGNDESPLKAWLNDPCSAELVLGTPL